MFILMYRYSESKIHTTVKDRQNVSTITLIYENSAAQIKNNTFSKNKQTINNGKKNPQL